MKIPFLVGFIVEFVMWIFIMAELGTVRWFHYHVSTSGVDIDVWYGLTEDTGCSSGNGVTACTTEQYAGGTASDIMRLQAAGGMAFLFLLIDLFYTLAVLIVFFIYGFSDHIPSLQPIPEKFPPPMKRFVIFLPVGTAALEFIGLLWWVIIFPYKDAKGTTNTDPTADAAIGLIIVSIIVIGILEAVLFWLVKRAGEDPFNVSPASGSSGSPPPAESGTPSTPEPQPA